MLQHQQRAIAAINAMRGPAEGRLLVEIGALWDTDDTIIVDFSVAIAMIRDNPRIEFKPIERWKLD